MFYAVRLWIPHTEGIRVGSQWRVQVAVEDEVYQVIYLLPIFSIIASALVFLNFCFTANCSYYNNGRPLDLDGRAGKDFSDIQMALSIKCLV